MKSNLKVAIVYDRVNKFGGAERVLLALKELYPKSVLFTSVFDPKGASWVGDWEVRTSFLQHLPWAKYHHEWLAPLMPLAFETLDLSGFDLIISVTSEFAKNVVTTPDQLHVCYCLTPTRYLWSHTREYGRGSLSMLKHLIFSRLRVVDYCSAQRPQAFIAISRRVKARIRDYYSRDAQVIYPPLTLALGKMSKLKKSKYFLLVSRLVAYKRTDLAIEACLKLKRHLYIVGTGTEGMKLYDLAANSPYIHFEGSVDDRRLGQLYQGASALICPQEEDFGLVSLEAQGSGVPVVSYKKSGVTETILDRKTGILFTEQTVGSLTQALRRAEAVNWNAAAIRRHAQRFGQKQFNEGFQRQIAGLWKKRRQ